MSTASPVAPSPVPIPTADVPYEMTVDLFSQMVELGLIPEDRRVYLFNGRLYEKMAKTMAQGAVGAAINMVVGRRLPDAWSLWPESTMALDPTNAPLPDFALIRVGNPLEFAALDRYPGPAEVGLFIEVAVTSLKQNMTTTLEQYARAMIPVYWVVDVLGRRILVHSEPRVVDGLGVYSHVETYGPGQSVPLVLDGHEVARIPFDELLR